MSLMQVMRLLAPNLWGWLADRLGAKTPIVRGAALMSLLGFSCFFFTQSFSGFFFGMALLAFFWSAALPLVEALTFTHLGAQASRYGAIRLWGSVGFIVAVLGLGWLLDRLPLVGDPVGFRWRCSAAFWPARWRCRKNAKHGTRPTACRSATSCAGAK